MKTAALGKQIYIQNSALTLDPETILSEMRTLSPSEMYVYIAQQHRCHSNPLIAKK